MRVSDDEFRESYRQPARRSRTLRTLERSGNPHRAAIARMSDDPPRRNAGRGRGRAEWCLTSARSRSPASSAASRSCSCSSSRCCGTARSVSRNLGRRPVLLARRERRIGGRFLDASGDARQGGGGLHPLRREHGPVLGRVAAVLRPAPGSGADRRADLRPRPALRSPGAPGSDRLGPPGRVRVGRGQHRALRRRNPADARPAPPLDPVRGPVGLHRLPGGVPAVDRRRPGRQRPPRHRRDGRLLPAVRPVLRRCSSRSGTSRW